MDPRQRSRWPAADSPFAGWLFIAVVFVVLLGLFLPRASDREASPTLPTASQTPRPAAIAEIDEAEQIREALAVEYAANVEAEQDAAETRLDRIDDVVATGGTLPEPNRDTTTMSTTTTVARVLDGDTLVTIDGYTVRLIGIDTPEIGTCGAEEAAEVLRDLTDGQAITLVNPISVDDFDKYGRILRYVDVDGVDTANTLLSDGLAVARYDYLDGYDWHPRQDHYREVDAATPHMCGPSAENDPDHILAIAPPQPEPEEPAGFADIPDPDDQSDEPWNQPGPDLNCDDIGHQVHITGEDYHDLDRDHDGIGCESWPPW